MAFSQTTSARSGVKARRVLLDSNIWRYVVDAGAEDDLLRLAGGRACEIQIAPAVVFEALRLEDIAIRDALVELMTNRRFTRLMPEAYSESEELLNEIRRHRPEWLRQQPDTQFFNNCRLDWTSASGFWARVESSPSSEANRLNPIQQPIGEGALQEAKLGKEEMSRSGWKRNPRMDKTFVRFAEPTPGWRGDDVEAWRAMRWVSVSAGIRQNGNAYRDWIAPFVEVDDGLPESSEWLEFWLYTAERKKLPRQWMRWAHSFAQRFRRVTTGSPADTQLFTHLLDADVFISSDRALVAILEECRPYAPRPLADGILVPGGRSGVEMTLSLLAKLRPRGERARSCE